MRSILITGGMGYIGNKFIELFSEKYDISVFDTSFFGQNKSDRVKI